MSTEVRFNYDDVLIAQDKEGKEYYLGIYQDEIGCDWIQDECPVGHLVTWHRNYRIGEKHEFKYPEDFWVNVFQENFIEDRKFVKFMLDYSPCYILTEAEIQKDAQYETDPDAGYYLCLSDAKGNLGWYVSLSSNKAEEMDSEDFRMFWAATERLSVSECEDMAEHIPDFVFYRVYMYDHSGIALSISNGIYPFNDMWDSGCLGYWHCTKKECEKTFGVHDDWEEQFHTYVKDAIEEFNEIESGNCWGFAYAPKDEIDSRLGQFENRHWWTTVLKDEITAYQEDSCWGYVGDYETLVKDFCSDEGLEIVGVVGE